MTDIALIFPGQGAQRVGMGKAFFDSSKEAKEIFDSADSILKNELSKIIFEGPQDKLMLTAYSQPAIVTVSIAALTVFKNHPKFAKINPKFAAGLSLGEYSALIAAGSFNFEEGLRLIQKRANFMEEATKLSKGSMAAIIGFDKVEIEKICRETGGVEIANFNSPQQTVITGDVKAVKAASDRMMQEGAKSVIPLEVSGAFHSFLMKPAAEKFKAELTQTAINAAQIPVISNVDARPEIESNQIRENLARQIVSSVQWVATVEYIASEGVTTFIEIGPGTVLKGLIRKINKDLKVYNIQTPEDIEKLDL